MVVQSKNPLRFISAFDLVSKIKKALHPANKIEAFSRVAVLYPRPRPEGALRIRPSTPKTLVIRFGPILVIAYTVHPALLVAA